jgi:peptidyl-prolyl cis-trans isomerase C
LFEKLKAWAREPLVHFLLIGAGIYGLYGLLASGDDADSERTVTVSAGDIQALADQWTRLWNRPPTEEELAGAIRDQVRVEILYREATAMGLDVGDTVIKRRLAQRVELLARSLITPTEPTKEDLRAWYADNLEAFKQPDLYSVAHVFFDPDKRDATTLDDAQAARVRLNELDEVPADFANYGDRFMLDYYYPKRTELELRKLFGSGFVDQIVDLQPGTWHGPILSGYGTHLVMIMDVALSPPPAYEEVESQIIEQWMGEQINEMSERFIDELVSRYEVDVEETQVPMTVPGQGATP